MSLALNETLLINEAVVLWILLDSILKTLREKILVPLTCLLHTSVVRHVDSNIKLLSSSKPRL